MVMYTFGQRIKIYRHLTVGGYQKRHAHSNFSKLLSNMINTTVIKIIVICDSFRRSKVIQHCKTLKMSMAYIFLM